MTTKSYSASTAAPTADNRSPARTWVAAKLPRRDGKIDRPGNGVGRAKPRPEAVVVALPCAYVLYDLALIESERLRRPGSIARTKPRSMEAAISRTNRRSSGFVPQNP